MNFERMYRNGGFSGLHFFQREVSLNGNEINANKHFPKMCRIILDRAMNQPDYDRVEGEGCLARITRHIMF